MDDSHLNNPSFGEEPAQPSFPSSNEKMESPLEELSRLRRELAEEIRAMREESSFSNLTPDQGKRSYEELIDFDTSAPVEKTPPKGSKDRASDYMKENASASSRENGTAHRDSGESSDLDKRFRTISPARFPAETHFRLDDTHLEFEGSRRNRELCEERKQEDVPCREDMVPSEEGVSREEPLPEEPGIGEESSEAEERPRGASDEKNVADKNAERAEPKLTLQEEMALLNQRIPDRERRERLSKIAAKLESDSDILAGSTPNIVKVPFGKEPSAKAPSREKGGETPEEKGNARILRIDGGHKEFLHPQIDNDWEEKNHGRNARRAKAPLDREMLVSGLIWFMLLLGLFAFIGGGAFLGWSFLFEQSEYLLVGMPISLAGTVLLLVGLLMQLFRTWGLANRPQVDRSWEKPRLDIWKEDLAPKKDIPRYDPPHESDARSNPSASQPHQKAEQKSDPTEMLEELKRQVESLTAQLAEQRKSHSSERRS